MNKIWIKPINYDKWCLKKYCLNQCGKYHSRIICKYGNNCINPYCTYIHNSHKNFESKLKNVINNKLLPNLVKRKIDNDLPVTNKKIKLNNTDYEINNKPIFYKNKTLSLCKFGCKCEKFIIGKCKYIHNSTNSTNSNRYFNKIIQNQSIKFNDGILLFYIDKKKQ